MSSRDQNEGRQLQSMQEVVISPHNIFRKKLVNKKSLFNKKSLLKREVVHNCNYFLTVLY